MAPYQNQCAQPEMAVPQSILQASDSRSSMTLSKSGCVTDALAGWGWDTAKSGCATGASAGWRPFVSGEDPPSKFEGGAPKIFAAPEGASVPGSRTTRIRNGIKGASSRAANLILRRKGHFWQDESFDHWVRNSKEFEKIRVYIENNPVSAGLVTAPQEWLWSSCAQSDLRPP